MYILPSAKPWKENIYQINSIIDFNKIDVMVFDLFYLKPSYHIL